MIAPQTETLLRRLPVARLVEMYCELNSWEWPAELADIKPDPYPAKADRVGWALMHIIFYLIADKMISRRWNNEMDEEEFNRQYTRNFQPI